jgi:hypothetical protein
LASSSLPAANVVAVPRDDSRRRVRGDSSMGWVADSRACAADDAAPTSDLLGRGGATGSGSGSASAATLANVDWRRNRGADSECPTRSNESVGSARSATSANDGTRPNPASMDTADAAVDMVVADARPAVDAIAEAAAGVVGVAVCRRGG